LRGARELRGYGADLLVAHRARLRGIGTERDGRWSGCRPSAFGGRGDAQTLHTLGGPDRPEGRLAAGMTELDGGRGACSADEPVHPRVAFDLCVVPEPRIARRDASFRCHTCGFEHHQRCAAQGSCAEMDEVPVVHVPVGACALAHRCDADAVAQGEATHPQRIEEPAHARLLKKTLSVL
jgi:hypothetical protein